LTINSIQKCSQKIFGFCLIDKRQTNTFFLLTCLKHYIKLPKSKNARKSCYGGLDDSYRKQEQAASLDMEFARLRREYVIRIPHPRYMQGIISIKEWLLNIV